MRAERLRRFDEADLYVVITEAFCAGRPAADVLDAVLAAGVKLVQLREKECEDRELYERAVVFREKTAAAEALLLIDDRIDVAMAVGADGVHLGQHDLPVRVARDLAPDLLIGASTHNLDELLRAQADGASVVNIGPVFETQTKSVSTGAIGVDMLKALLPQVSVPWSCMGGIKRHNIGQVAALGARHPAVVTAVTEAEDVAAAAKELRGKLLAQPGA